MSLSPEDREQVIDAAVDLLRHHKRERLLKILEDRLERDDYPRERERERDLDRVALALARAIDEQLGGSEGEG